MNNDMEIKIDLDAFNQYIEVTAKEVSKWPAWKRGNIDSIINSDFYDD